ncbi:MAG: histidine--tRNA ligase [Planctomycetota bacterium]|nr:histidine--tRNA ligase [Planctomycetota bacterium]
MSGVDKIQGPKGTRDFYPSDMAVRRHIESAWRSASIRHGYDEIDGPTFEHLNLYTIKSGEGITNELFSFRRAGGENDYALRPEFTPTLARMVAARGPSLSVPTRWFAVPNFFRAERQQRGRLREFYQWNVDMLGIDSPTADAEVISVALLALESLGLRPGDVTVRISHRGAVAGALSAIGIAPEHMDAAFTLLDRKDKLPPAEFIQRAPAIGLDDKGRVAFEQFSGTRAPMTGGVDLLAKTAGIDAASLGSLEATRDALRSCSLEEWCEWDLGIVRGLAYYTGVVFEIHATGERAVAGGGRYDRLVELFGGPKTPAVGFGMGDVVLGLVLADKGLLPKDPLELLPRPDCFLIAADDAGAMRIPSIASTLRRSGAHVRTSSKSSRNVGKLLSDAARSRARMAVIVGAELSDGLVTVKDLASGAQHSVPLDELSTFVRA